jgi:F0F1-type ATP synthase membrane subunit c/vacuolar-type H+-ATPase subunit K
MSEQQLEQVAKESNDDGKQFLRKVIIAFAIVEALVMIPIILRMIFR